MSDPVYRIGFDSDQHYGYAAKCRIHPASGLNMRVRDGYLAGRERMTQMIEAEVDLILNGGDIFHRSHPGIADIVWARQQFERAARAGIPVIGITGNHDASAERGKAPATAVLHDPGRGIDMVTEPYRILRPVDGLAIHAVSHYGLAQAERLIPEPIDGVVNILTSHGAAMLPGHEVFRCVDSPGEQPIGLDLILDDRYAVKALGHYHGMDEIMDGVWYAGSALRRGFSDPAGGRGWLLLNVFADGRVVVERKYIEQRAQYDLPVIDAAGLTGADVEERIRANLAKQDVTDAIVRQVVTNCTMAVRRGIDMPALAKIAAPALMWTLDARRPEFVDFGERVVTESMATVGSADLPGMYTGWVRDYTKAIGLAEELVPVVVAEGERHLRDVSEGVESGADAVAPSAVQEDDAKDDAKGVSPQEADAASPESVVSAAPASDAEYVFDEEPPW